VGEQSQQDRGKDEATRGAEPRGSLELEEENSRLREEVARLESELKRLREENEALRRAAAQRSEDKAELAAQLMKEKRAARRQSAPFSKGEPKQNPKPPGRKRGAKYGQRASRPRPERVDRTVAAPIPEACPRCQGPTREERTEEQFLVDLPEPRSDVTRILVGVGRCEDPACGARVQGRHPLQISDALGAASVQLGPRVLAFAAGVKSECGTSWGKIATVLVEHFELPVARSTLCRAFQRLGQNLEPSWDALRDAVRAADEVSADETGWRVAARTVWLWAFITDKISLYSIRAGRGFEEAAAVLGEAFSGVLVRDGWAPYRRFKQAIHQTCIPHILRRCRRILETEPAADPESFPHRVKRLLLRALELRDRAQADEISPHGFAIARGQLKVKLERLVQERPEPEEHRKLAKHLRNELDALLTFLSRLGVQASSWLAELELRAPISTRKACGGGNRTWTGAKSLAINLTVIRTARRQGLRPGAVITRILRSRATAVATELLPATSDAPEPRPP